LVVGGLVDGFGVAVWLGRGVGFVVLVGLGERVPWRLGALVDRVGVGVGVALGVFDGVLEGVTEGAGVSTGLLASSVGVTSVLLFSVSG
jgi:hypothetical protein